MDLGYFAAQSQVTARQGLEETAVTLVGKWELSLTECVEGYAWEVAEYNNEIGVRDRIGALLEAPGLRGFAGHQELKQQVEALDVHGIQVEVAE